VTGRVAGAPISWGVCEVPGWGYQIAADRVLAEMAQAGLVATEFGPDGFLPANLGARKDMLHGYGLAAVGGFVPAVLHDPDRDPVAGIRAVLPSYLAAGASTLVLAAATGLHGYEHRPALDARGWRTLLSNMDRVAAVTAEAGISATLHPHVGTMVERPDEIDRVLDGAAIGLCLDTGHVLVGGGDPAELAGTAAGRIRHVHLKDVDAELAARVRDGASSYRDAVAAGLYRPLGRGDASIAAIVSTLDAAGYAGWYVLEQDTVLAGEPPAGNGPLATVQESLAWLASR
jgi:inosose dehydratase